MLSINPEDCEEVDAELIYTERHAQFYESAQKHFPNWNNYVTLENEYSEVAESTILTGNPHDDVADIACEFEEALWILENVNENATLDNLLLSYQVYWKWHMRILQCYLHQLHA